MLTTYGDALNEFKSIKDDKVYDISGQTMNGWYGVRKVEPDTLIQDFCKVVGNEAPLAAIPHRLTFLRHVDDPVASKYVCTDTSAPYVKLGSQCNRIIIETDKPVDPKADPESDSEDGVEDVSDDPKADPESDSEDGAEDVSDDSHASSKNVLTSLILTAASLAQIVVS